MANWIESKPPDNQKSLLKPIFFDAEKSQRSYAYKFAVSLMDQDQIFNASTDKMLHFPIDEPFPKDVDPLQHAGGEALTGFTPYQIAVYLTRAREDEGASRDDGNLRKRYKSYLDGAYTA